MKDINGKTLKNGDVATIVDNSRCQIVADARGPLILYRLDKRTWETQVVISMFPMGMVRFKLPSRPSSPRCYVSKSKKSITRHKASR